MKITRYLILALLTLMAFSKLEAQQRNALKIPDATVQIGEVQLPVVIENTDEITGVQFDLTLPTGVTAENNATITERCDGHIVIIRNIEATRYRVMLFSNENRPLRGQLGTVFNIPLNIPQSFKEGNEYPITISNAALSKASGENVMSEFTTGKISITKLPDLTVMNIKAENKTITPGENLSMSWQVQNIGGANTGGGWSEQILLVNKRGTVKKLIATIYQQDILAAGSTMSRQADITVPQLLGIEGDAYLQVHIVSNTETGESTSAQGNNFLQTDEAFSVAKRLFVEPSPASIVENATKQVAIKVSRSGDWSGEQTFMLKSSEDSRISGLPNSITIPVGQSGAIVYLKTDDNQVLDDNSIVTITAEGNNYPTATGELVIEDNEYPDLKLTASKSQITEGESFKLTVTISRKSNQPIVVTLTSENAKRFNYPSQVTIPAGETSVDVDVETTDDDIPSIELSNAFTASAEHFNKAETIVILTDNDMPILQLELTPDKVQESAGVISVTGVLRRTTNTNSKITVKLTDDADGGLYFGNRTLTLDKGVEEVHFNFGPVDNALVDGDRTYTITAVVWLSSCNCGATGESAGYVTAQLQVLDNDGAALSLTSSANTVKEGGKTTLTVSRNTSDTSKALTVTLSSDYEEGLTYNHTVIIPAGQQLVTVEVITAANSVQGDSHTAVFTVQASGYATGTCYLNVTDQTMPDARITALRADRTQIEVGEQLSVTVVVANEGVDLLPSGTTIALSFSGSSSKELLYTPADLAVGESVVLSTEYAISSSKPGNYTLKATVNADKEVRELNYNNNTSQDLAITLLPNFTATASVDKNIYRQGETITISGQTSAGGRNANVEVYLVNDGTRQSITVQADAEGYFKTTYQPYNRQAGHFIVGACYPGTGETAGSAEFNVYGLRLSSYYDTHDISLGDEAKGTIIVENPGQLPQTGMSIVSQVETTNNEFSLASVSAIEPGGHLEIPYTLKGNTLTDGNDWQQIPLHITSAEGSTADYTIYFYVRSLKGQLKTSQSRIETNITKGVPRDYQFQISNVGRGETGRITLSLPTWVESLTPSELPSMNQGDTATVVLRLKTTDDMQLNVPVTGQIGINCDNGDGVPISLKLTPVSEATGHLVIDVVDEYSYYAEGSPHVEGAKVLVKHPTTGQVVAQGMTASDGHYSVELPEGWYTVSINADKHQGYQTTLEVAPGKQTGKQIFLTYEAISYNWEVTETEVEDVYEIETVVKYETNVPKPVVIITLPEEKPEVGSVIAVLATNKGLISANNVDMTLSVSDGYELEWLTDPTLPVLAPQQTATFYARVKEADNQLSRRVTATDVFKSIVCLTLYAKLLGYYICGDYDRAFAIESSKAWGECISSSGGGSSGSSSGGDGGSSGWNDGGSGGGGGGYPHSSPSSTNNQKYTNTTYMGPLTPTKKVCHEKDIEPLTLPDIIEPTEPGVANCGEAVIGDFFLIPAEGPIRKVNGVAADGASAVYIMLDGSSKLPIENAQCEMAHNWTLLEEAINGEEGTDRFGKLENTDCWYGVKYTAPDDFPGGPNENSYTVHAILEFYDGDQIGIKSVPIEIKRAPVVLLHGLGISLGPIEIGGSEETWNGFKDNVTKAGMYDSYQVLNKGYKDSYKASFKKNEQTANERIKEVINNYLCHGIVAKKADLVGHSMGGVLARLHVQYVDNTNVHKLITVNTPHSGSRVGNAGVFVDPLMQIIQMRNNVYIHLFNSVFKTDISEMDWQAYADLGTISSPTLDYLNNNNYLDRMNNIPIHAIVTENHLSSVEVSWNLMDTFWDLAAKAGLLLEDAIEGPTEGNDGIVSVKSQKGGLEGLHYSLYHNQGHSSTDNDEVQKRLKELLNASVQSGIFCMTGFRPPVIALVRELHTTRTNNASSRRQSPQSKPVVTATVNDNILTASMTGAEGYDYQMILVQFGKDAYSIASGSHIECEVPASFSGDVTIYGVVRMEDEDILWNKTQVMVADPRAGRESISISGLSIYYGESQSVSLTCTWSDGSQTRVTPDAVTFTDGLASYADGVITGLHGGSGVATFTYQGLSCEAPFTVYNFGKSDDNESSQSVCSTITLKLSQTMTMTRQAFRGTLTVFNGNASGAMRDVRLSLTVTDPNGKIASSHEFQINAESLDGFTGEVDLTSGWTLAANSTGTATVLFIPTKFAAPTEPVEWSFGGTLSYIDPFTGLEVTRDLYPVTLTVKPSPELDLTYFMQRDVFGDDPMTLDVVEPMIPAEFALLINNKGYGDATNVRMVTQQPEIIENEKGLHIDFELISSQVNGGDAALSFGQNIANDFGTIPAHSQIYAQWWLQSSLLGHFTEYDVKATHVTSYGNEDLSLLGDVTIHELIRGFYTATNEHGQTQRAFLVNDIPDANDLPDKLYFTNGDTARVSIATTATIERTSPTTCLLTITPSTTGWNYGSLIDPTHGYADLKSIVRQSDGKELGNSRFWQTDRTLLDGKDWLYEYRLHFVDEFADGSPITYKLTFDPVPDQPLEVSSIGTIPEEGKVAEAPIDQLTIVFNKTIDAKTFTSDDISYAVQGVKQDVSMINILSEDNQSFTLDLTSLNEQLGNGYYTLSVQTADITDAEGYKGKTGKQVGWIMFRGGLVQLLTSAYPEKSGTVTRKAAEPANARRLDSSDEDPNTAKYGSTVILVAEPSEGYEFTNWTLNGEVVSTDVEFETTALGDMNIVANFKKKSYMVDIAATTENGRIEGTATGIYEHGTEIELEAVPATDFKFTNWTVNGETVETDGNTLTLTADKVLNIDATFIREYYRQSMTFAKGWNWISAYLGESLDVSDFIGFTNRIVSQTEELTHDPEYGMVGNLKNLSAGKAYKIEANNQFTNSFRGHLYDMSTSPISLYKGWNWIAFPYTENTHLTAVSNADEGDFITSQTGFAEYADGNWEGTLDTLIPGNGYLYKSATEKDLSFDFSETASSRAKVQTATAQPSGGSIIDIHRYPNTMNMTIQLFRDGMSVSTDEYNIYAMAGSEIRGVGIQVGDKHYLTVYGSEPVKISFIIESTETGETYEAKEVLKFQDDVVGSRKNPFALNIGNATGIDIVGSDKRPMMVYSLQGVLISRDATLKILHNLPKGVYIINGQKCFIK